LFVVLCGGDVRCRYEALVYNEMNGLEDLYLTSTIVDTELAVGPFTGNNLAHCFGFKDRVRFVSPPPTRKATAERTTQEAALRLRAVSLAYL
jgi:hypothetical protein